MALSLSAEQKELLKIFNIEEQYVVPPYQRPYSWEYEQCFQLYNDLLSAYDDGQDYFIGNIIIAKADNNKESLEVVDGQQRLITTLLLLKILSLLQPQMKVLNKILEKEDWEGNNRVGRIRSDIFETDDQTALAKVLEYSLSDLGSRYADTIDATKVISERLCGSRFEANILFFYSWLKFFERSRSDLKDFTQYLLTRVYLLPIELSGPTQEEANEKALVIFETINNRGMNLEDADIFKAKLYNKAKNIKEEKIFIEKWTDFKSSCDSLGISIDDAFRYYSHIIRGKEGITASEKNLREFFTNERFSPLEQKKYDEVLSDLFTINEILAVLSMARESTTPVAKWLQITDAYTNQYPRYAIVNYLFVRKIVLDSKFVAFLKSLVRYIYYQGSTTTIKFEIYNIIKQTSLGFEIGEYLQSSVTPEHFSYLGRLKKGYALLAFYLDSQITLPYYYIDKIFTLNDEKSLTDDWEDVDLYEIVDMLGNYVVLDIPKKNISLSRKRDYYSASSIEDVRNIFEGQYFSYDDFLQRDTRLKNLLVHFFSSPN